MQYPKQKTNNTMEVTMKKLMTIAAAGLLLAGVGAIQVNAAETAESGTKTTLEEGLKNGAKNGLKKGLKNGLKKGMKNGKKNGEKR